MEGRRENAKGSDLNRGRERTSGVVVHELGHIEDLAVDDDPAICFGIVLQNRYV